MPHWTVTFDRWHPGDEPRREALCALGNGFFVTRGADETRRPHDHEVHYPGLYLAGGYNRAVTDVSGRTIENEDLVNFPNWIPLTFRPVGGEWFDPHALELLDFEQRLELRSGRLVRWFRVRDDARRTTRLVSQRFVSMRDPHLAAIRWELTPEDWDGELEIRSEIDGRVDNSGVQRYNDLTGDHFGVESKARPAEGVVSLAAITHQSRLRVALAARTRVSGADADDAATAADDEDRIGTIIRCRATAGRTINVEKIAAVYTSRDQAVSEPALEAGKAARDAAAFSELFDRHALAWDRLWRRFDMLIGDAEHLRLLRLHTFHLLQVASPHAADLDVGVPARGWHGEAYRGHILWDELFVFPLLSLRTPDQTRALLMYRYRRLGEARKAARARGRRGARFPWQSGSNGREESQTVHLNPRSRNWIPDNSQHQRHINLAVAFNVWHYLQCTGDDEFLASYGAELMIECARELADRAEPGDDGRWHIRGVMGPDEFHEAYPNADQPGVDDNAYTNVMTSWLFMQLPDVLGRLPEQRLAELRHDLALADDELAHWDELSRNLTVPFTAGGVIDQFEGFSELEPFPWDEYRQRYDDLQRLDRILEGEGRSPNEFQVTKQADVLMLFFLFTSEELEEQFGRLGYRFDQDLLRKNVDHYLKRTSHGSTLSRIVHAWALASCDPERSWRLFTEALRSDIDDIQGGTTAEGIHLGAMAGTVDLLHRCYAGVRPRRDALHIRPRLPSELPSVCLEVRFRGQRLGLTISGQRVELRPGDDWRPDTPVRVCGDALELRPGETRVVKLDARAAPRP